MLVLSEEPAAFSQRKTFRLGLKVEITVIQKRMQGRMEVGESMSKLKQQRSPGVLSRFFLFLFVISVTSML